MIALSNAMDYKRDDALYYSFFHTHVIIMLTTDFSRDGWSTTYFKPSPKMSSYLLAFIISEFAYKSSQTDKGVTVINFFILHNLKRFTKGCFFLKVSNLGKTITNRKRWIGFRCGSEDFGIIRILF